MTSSESKSLERGLEPSVEAVAVGRDGHRLLYLPLQERLEEEQRDDAQDEEEEAEDGRGRAAVPRVLAVAASTRGIGVARGLKSRKYWLKEYWVVQPDFTQEIKVFCLLFVRSLTILTITPLKREIWTPLYNG